MGININKAIKKISKKETKILNSVKKESIIKEKIYQKVPDQLLNTLEFAFIKAFDTIFSKGTKTIEKTFDKENISLEFLASNFIIDIKDTKKTLSRIDKPSKKSNLFNHAVTTTTGLGMGFLGMGLPDIPLLVGTVLKGVYETALSYGISYDSEHEKIYILRLIRVALSNGEEKIAFNEELDLELYENINVKSEIEQTAKIMARELLVEKFVQGLPIVGIIGGAVNFATYQKISTLAVIKYKKRYLCKKI